MNRPPLSRPATTIALLLMMAVVAVSRYAFLTTSTNMWDSVDYANGVERLLAKGWFVRFDTIELDHPLYAYLVGALHKLITLFGGPNDVLTSCKLFGVVMATLALPPVLWIGRWLFVSSRWGLLAVAVFAVNPLSWWWASEVMSDAAGVTLMLWALGLAARWAETGSTRSLVAGCLVLGAGVLLRIAVVLGGPAFLLIVAIGLVRHRRVRPALALLLTPVPALLFIAAQSMMHGLSFGSYFELTPQNEIDRTLARSIGHWLEIGRLVSNGLGVVALGVTVLGFVAAATRHFRLFVLAVLWLGPVLFVEATNADTVIRYYLPLMPLSALLTVSFCRSVLARLPHGTDAVAAVCGLAMTAMVWHAVPNLIALRYAESAMDVSARWYRDRSPSDAVVVGMCDYNHVRCFSNRQVIRYHPEVVGKPWETRPDNEPLSLDDTLIAIRAAIAAGRPVFVSDVVSTEAWTELLDRLVVEPVETLGDDTTPVRNALDPGFSEMNELWRSDRPVTIYRVQGVAPRERDETSACP